MTTTLVQGTIDTDLVPSPVSYRVLHPDGPTAGLPLLLFLHGGGGSDDFLVAMRPIFERAWADGSLPPLVVATPSAGRSFYLDRFDGSQRWEQFLLHELLPHLVRSTGAGAAAGGGGARAARGAVALAGVSMGGMGSLRLAFREPERFVAVAAVEPAIEEATDWDQVLLRDRVYREDRVVHELFGDPVDRDHFRANHPRALAERNAARLAASGLAIYVECGDRDLLHLQYGAEALHRQLFAHGIDHEYRLVRGGNHIGASLGGRVADALRFVGRALAGDLEDDPAEDPMLAGFAGLIRQQEDAGGYRRTELVDGPDGPLEVHVQGQGPAVVLVPSLGRAAADFDALGARLARAGYQAVRPEPRGIGGSDSPLDEVTLADLADDVAAVIRAVATGPGAGTDGPTATVVGHAFGNRVARMVATRHPDLVESVVLLACGGQVPPTPEVSTALLSVFDATLPAAEHLDAVRTAFFAPGHDPSVWADGWYAEVATAQAAATAGTPVEEWWEAGRADVLVVQPADDVVAVPENAHRIIEALGDRAAMVTVPRSGHALLPEQPAAVATALLSWLDRRTRGAGAPSR